MGAGATDLFGDPIPENSALNARFVVPPFSVLDARQGYWQDRKRAWLSLGIESELGRGGGQVQADQHGQPAITRNGSAATEGGGR